jgi:hypothetical protein
MSATVRSPNPRRVEAGRLNRQKRLGLTPEGRQRLRTAARAFRPWEHATGPRTAQGKARSAQNGRGRQGGEVSRRRARAAVSEALDLARARARARAALAERAAGG